MKGNFVNYQKTLCEITLIKVAIKVYLSIYFSKAKYKKFLDNLDQKRKFPLDFMMDMEYLYKGNH